jgi:hypothetical protein
MHKFIGILTAVVLASQLNHTAAARIIAEYPDVPINHWAFKAVNAVSGSGLIEGMPGGNFVGDKATTRYEIAVALARVNIDPPARPNDKPPGLESTNPSEATRIPYPRPWDRIEYPDVPRKHWAADSIEGLSRAGIFEGLPDGTFGATRPLTRYDCA